MRRAASLRLTEPRRLHAASHVRAQCAVYLADDTLALPGANVGQSRRRRERFLARARQRHYACPSRATVSYDDVFARLAVAMRDEMASQRRERDAPDFIFIDACDMRSAGVAIAIFSAAHYAMSPRGDAAALLIGKSALAPRDAVKRRRSIMTIIGTTIFSPRRAKHF